MPNRDGAFRLRAAVLVLLYAFGSLLSVIHFSTTRHVACPEHGAEHRGFAEGDHSSTQERTSIGDREEDRDHHACGLNLALQPAPQLSTPAVHVTVLDLEERPDHVPTLTTTTWRGRAVLSYAPKQSPPLSHV